MKNTSALNAAIDQGGWNHKQTANIPAAEIRAYFSENNFRAMFGADGAEECGGYSLDECAEAVIEWQKAEMANHVAAERAAGTCGCGGACDACRDHADWLAGLTDAERDEFAALFESGIHG